MRMIDQIIAGQTDVLAARRTADSILHLLRDFIPRGCERAAWDLLVETAFKEGWELTNKATRKEHEAWRKTQLDMLNLQPLTFHKQDPESGGAR
jgi:hypothetical protein